MSIDISGLSMAELKELAVKIEKRTVQVEKETLQTALREMRAVADKLGVAFEDVIAQHNGKGTRTATETTPKPPELMVHPRQGPGVDVVPHE